MVECRCLLIVIALSVAAVYAFCIIATRAAFTEADSGVTEIYQHSTESGKLPIEMIASKSGRIVRSGPVVQELKVMELYELQKNKNAEQVFNMKIFLKIKWIEDYRDQSSKAFENLELLLISGIEDLFDKKFYEQNKSVSIRAVEMRRVKKPGGVLIKTKVTSLEGDIEIEELKTAIEDGAQVLYREISGKLAAGIIDGSGSDEMFSSTEKSM